MNSHLMHSKDDPFSEFAVTLHEATELLFHGFGSDFRVSVEAVSDNREEALFNGCLVIFEGLFVEAPDTDLERSRNRHDIMFAIVVITEFEDTLGPEELVT